MSVKRTRSKTGIFLSVMLLLNLVPGVLMTAQAANPHLASSYDQRNDVSFSARPSAPVEVVAARTATSKRFLNPDGTYTEKMYTTPIHYKDASGKWVPIDSNVDTDSKGKFHNKANQFSIDFPQTASDDFIHVADAGAIFSFKPLFAKNPSKGKSNKNKIDYTDVTDDTDLSYAVMNNGLKESLVLKSVKSPSSYSFELNMDHLTYQTEQDGSIQFFQTGETTPLFVLAKPYLEDAKHEQSDKVTYNIHKDDSGKTFLDVQADSSWLQDPNRAFPVILDPSVTFTKGITDIQDTFVDQLDPTHTKDTYLHNLVGHGDDHGITRALYTFPLFSLPDAAVITDATFSVCNDIVDYPDQLPTVEVQPINGNWNPNTITWNLENTLSIGGVSSTYQVKNTTPDWWDIPMTSLVQSWFNGTQSMYGFELRLQDETNVLRQLTAAGDPNYSPFMSITYTIDGLGQEPFWTFDGPVNMSNLNLVRPVTDADFPGRGVDLKVSRIYNNRSSNTGVFGHSWNSLLDMHLDLPAKGSARLIDEQRTVHYFYQNTDGTYAPLSGLYWKLTVSGGVGTVSTPDKTQYFFNASGQLTKIQDANGNTTTLTYSSGQDTMQDAAGHKFTFTLTNGKVSSVTDPAGQVWSYTYDSGSNLIKVNTPDPKVVLNYKYDSNHNLIAEVSPTGKTTYYEYSSDDRLVAINPNNMLTNGNFEVDADGSGIPDHFTYDSGYPNLTIDKNPPASAPSGQAVKIDTSSVYSSPFTVYLSDAMAIDPTKSYTLSTWVTASQASGTQSSIYSLYAYDANGNKLGEVGRSEQTGAFGWKRVSTTVGAGTSSPFPAGTTSVKVKVSASNATGAGDSWFDEMQLEQGATMNEFSSGTQYTSDQATMKAASYDGEGHKKLYTYNNNQNMTEVSQDPLGLNLKDDYGWTSNTISSYTDPLQHTDVIETDANGNVTKVTDAMNNTQNYTYDTTNNMTQYVGTGGASRDTYLYTYDDGRNNLTSRDPYYTSQAKNYDAYGHVLSSTNPLGWADNLVDNSSFENGVQTSGLPVSYNLDSVGQPNATLAKDALYGANSIKLSPNAGYTVVTTNPIAVDTTSDYVLSGNLKTDADSTNQVSVLSAYAYDSASPPNNLGEIGRWAITGARSTWQHISTPIHPSDFPAKTATIRVKIAASNATGTGNTYADGLQFQKNPVETAYNLLDNSSFERGSTWPDHWSKLTGTSSYVWSTSTYYAGARSVALSNPTAGDGVTYDQYIPYNSSKAYNLSAFVHTMTLSPAAVSIRIDEFDANKKWLGQVASAPLGGTTNWKRVNVQLDASNVLSGTAYIKPVFYATATATGNLHFENVRLQSNAVVTTNTYDSTSTWLKSAKDPLGNLVQYEYYNTGNLKTITDPMGYVTSHEYDALDHLTATIPPGNDVRVDYNYDEDGNLKSIQDKDPSDTTTFSEMDYLYNQTGDLQKSTDSLGRSETFSYTPAGREQMVQTFDENNQNANMTVSMQYDKANRLTDEFFNGTAQYHYDYNNASLLTSVSDKVQGRTWTSAYDALNRLQTWGDGTGKITYTFDPKRNDLTGRSITVGTGYTRSQSIVYNNVHEPISMQDQDGTSKYLYNELGKVSLIQSGNGMVERVGYDSDGRIQTVENEDKTGKLMSFYQLQYDVDGNVKFVKDQNGTTLYAYEYNEKNEMTSETLDDGTKVTYLYDPVGNRKERTEAHTDGTTKTTSYQYDAANELKTVDGTEWKYDARGHLILNGTYSFKWDAGGRLIEVDKASDNSQIASYQYDELNRRTQEKTTDATGVTKTTNFLYDGMSNHVIAEYDPATGTVSKSYTWSQSGQLLSFRENNTTYYAIHNAHGDVIELVHTLPPDPSHPDGSMSNPDATYSYDAFGNTTKTGTIAADNPYRYADYRFDDLTGLYYLIGRYYDPTVGRFLSQDPASEIPDYVYAVNNPIGYVDPTGYDSILKTFLMGEGGGGGGGTLRVSEQEAEAIVPAPLSNDTLRATEYDEIQEMQEAATVAKRTFVRTKIGKLPEHVQTSYKKYDKAGWKGNVPGQSEGTKAGKVWKNKKEQLPTKDSDGNPIIYKEFDVNEKLPDEGRDAERFVAGSDGSVYYTDSHYGGNVSPTGLPDFVRVK